MMSDVILEGDLELQRPGRNDVVACAVADRAQSIVWLCYRSGVVEAFDIGNAERLEKLYPFSHDNINGNNWEEEGESCVSLLCLSPGVLVGCGTRGTVVCMVRRVVEGEGGATTTGVSRLEGDAEVAFGRVRCISDASCDSGVAFYGGCSDGTLLKWVAQSTSGAAPSSLEWRLACRMDVVDGHSQRLPDDWGASVCAIATVPQTPSRSTTTFRPPHAAVASATNDGQLSVWDSAGTRMYAHWVFPSHQPSHSVAGEWSSAADRIGGNRPPSPLITALHAVDVLGDLRVWVGGATGELAVVDAASGETIQRLHDVSAFHSRAIVAIASFPSECKVWSASVDGTFIAWDPVAMHVLCRVVHPNPVVAVLDVSLCTMVRRWAIGQSGFTQCLLSSTISDPHETQRQCDHLVLLLDGAIDDMRKLQSDRQRLVLGRVDAVDQHRIALSGAEVYGRSVVVSLWADTLETLLVTFLLASKLLLRSATECRALADEREHLSGLIATALQKNDPPPSPQAMAAAVQCSIPSPTTRIHHMTPTRSATAQMMTSPTLDDVRFAAVLQERDAQIRQLQDELLRTRRETDRHIEGIQQTFQREAQALRNVAQDQRRSIDALRDDVSVKEALLEETRAQVRSLREECTQVRERHRLATEEAVTLAHTAETRKKDYTAMQLELNELRLAHQVATQSHQTERKRLQHDLQSMQAPWESMKHALHETQRELDAVRTQAAQHIAYLEDQLHRQQPQLGPPHQGTASTPSRIDSKRWLR